MLAITNKKDKKERGGNQNISKGWYKSKQNEFLWSYSVYVRYSQN